MRILIHVPIVHSEAEMGSLLGQVRRGFAGTFGEARWASRQAAVEAMWDGLTSRILGMPLSWPEVRLYQDGLPICGREADIVRDVAAQGSRNHKLLLELMERGAALTGTESPDLMLREYRRIRSLIETVASLSDDDVVRLSREGDTLLAERDAFVARRIEETLEEGRTGIGFFGMMHRVDEALHGDIQITHVIHNLPFGIGAYRAGRSGGDGH